MPRSRSAHHVRVASRGRTREGRRRRLSARRRRWLRWIFSLFFIAHDIVRARPVPFSPQQTISADTVGALSAFAGDLDRDGDLDIVTVGQGDLFGGEPSEVAWHEKLGNGSFASAQSIATYSTGPLSVRAADIDCDGDLDLVVASVVDSKIDWRENLDGEGAFGPSRSISASAGTVRSVFIADMDRDGDPDVLAASGDDDTIALHRNLDGNGNFGGREVVGTDGDYALAVLAADVDGDGDQDVVASSFYEIAVYENTDGLANFSTSTPVTASFAGAVSLDAADVDRDGDVDVLAASILENKVVVFRNNGAGGFGAAEIISAETNYAASVATGDVDGDGDLDVLSASADDGKFAWYEGSGGQGPFGPQQLLSTATDALSVSPVDLDGDGDLDVVTAAFAGSVGLVRNELIHESAFLSTTQVVGLPSNPLALALGDVDGDGDLDVVAALAGGSGLDPSLVLAFNQDGLFGAPQALSTTTIPFDSLHRLAGALDGGQVSRPGSQRLRVLQRQPGPRRFGARLSSTPRRTWSAGARGRRSGRRTTGGPAAAVAAGAPPARPPGALRARPVRDQPGRGGDGGRCAGRGGAAPRALPRLSALLGTAQVATAVAGGAGAVRRDGGQ